MSPEQAQKQFDQQYEAAEAKQLLKDDDFKKIHNLSVEDILKQPENTQKAYLSTLKYHNQQRMSLSSLDGIVIGDKSIEEL